MVVVTLAFVLMVKVVTPKMCALTQVPAWKLAPLVVRSVARFVAKAVVYVNQTKHVLSANASVYHLALKATIAAWTMAAEARAVAGMAYCVPQKVFVMIPLLAQIRARVKEKNVVLCAAWIAACANPEKLALLGHVSK